MKYLVKKGRGVGEGGEMNLVQLRTSTRVRPVRAGSSWL